MLTAKKKKIEKCAFDLLLSDYLDGSLKEYLASAGIKKADIHIDWFDDMKCIGIQGRYKEHYMDLQIYPDEFCVSFDPDEPDEDAVYSLESKEQLYSVLVNIIKTL